jgi:Fic family protein
MKNRYLVPSCHTFKHIFIENSNAIDPQPGYDGDHKFCPLYQNHIDALEFMLDTSWVLTKDTPLDAHRILTKGIKFFEDKGLSGKYRERDVFIGNEICPSAFRIPDLMSEWFSITQSMIEQGHLSSMQIAWASHHMFEIIHPFIDGNGRTGRLILNKILSQLGEEPVVVYYKDRFEYYDSINYFRKHHFDNGKFVNLEELNKGA